MIRGITELLAEARFLLGLAEWEEYVDDDGWAHDDEGNRWRAGPGRRGTIRTGQGGIPLDRPRPPAPAAGDPRIAVLLRAGGPVLRDMAAILQKGGALSDDQKKKIRHELYKRRMKAETEMFR